MRKPNTLVPVYNSMNRRLMRTVCALGAALCAAVELAAAPLSIDASNPFNPSNGTIRIRLTGESGVEYFVRTTTHLEDGEWLLARTNGYPGTGGVGEIDVPIPAGGSSQLFLNAESAYERRARLFIENYQRQLDAGGPVALTVNGQSVQNTITISEDRTNNVMTITGNGVPNYTPTVMGLNVTDGWNTPVAGGFQSLKFSENNQGASGGNNPNRVVVATEVFRVPLNPVINSNVTETALGTVGVAINGLPIYNPFEDANQTAALGRIFSTCCGHPQLTGVYHYHKYPTCLKLLRGDAWRSEKEKCDELDALVAGGGHSPLIGFALDGWPVYGPVGWSNTGRVSKLLKSSYTGVNDAYGNPSYVAGSGDLDECNGLVSPTPEFPEGIYHYVMTIEANPDGSVLRYINPYFGYDVRNTLRKHGLMPATWETDTDYVGALKAGFNAGSVAIPGTDSNATFYDFIVGMTGLLASNGMAAAAAEFETMKIAYPFTIRKYRGTPVLTGGGGAGAGHIITAVPSSGSRGQSYALTITLAANATPPLPPAQIVPNSVTVGGVALTGVARPASTSVTGTLAIPAGATTGAKSITVTFPGPPGQPAPSYTGQALFNFL